MLATNLNLPAKQQQLWDAYVAAEQIRVRQNALNDLASFVESLQTIPGEVWHPWALEIAKQLSEPTAAIPVRLPLFRSVLFPPLFDALRTGGAEPARQLGGLSRFLFHCKECLEKLPKSMRSEFGLLRKAIRRDPKDTPSKRRLSVIYQSRFDYVLHELPNGVLYGHDGATINQCAELIAELEDYKKLVGDIGGSLRDAELIEAASFYIPAYLRYLPDRERYEGFPDYLSHHGRI